MRLLKSFFTAVLVIAFTGVFAQKKSDILVYGKVVDFFDESRLKTATVVAEDMDNGETVKADFSKGKFNMILDYDKEYMVTFSETGYSSKKVHMNFKNVPEKQQKGGQGFDLDIKLGKKYEGLDDSILERPVGVAKYSAEAKGVAFDKSYEEKLSAEFKQYEVELKAAKKDKK